VHLRRSGKPEEFQGSVGFYFTDQPPTHALTKILLTSMTMDIPAGATNYVVTDSFTLPVNASVISMLPHAHYLAHDLMASVKLPTGQQRTLLRIRNWDFNWQGDYPLAKPIFLPAGTEVSMRYSYDNSTNNFRNPNSPPKPVTYGSQSTDEMAEFWLQLELADSAEQPQLLRACQAKTRELFAGRCEDLLRKNPANAKDLVTLGSLLMAQGRNEEALPRLLKAVSVEPNDVVGHFNLGLLFMQLRQFPNARIAFENVLGLDPQDAQAEGSLGVVCLHLRQYREAITHLQQALVLDPDDAIARANLEMVRRGLERGPSQKQ
jgi:tetratricopeptide (TPR) repeat protein